MTIETVEPSPEFKEQEIKRFFELKVGSKDQLVIIEADHAIGQIGVKDIVNRVSEKLNSTSMIAVKPREEVDVARRGSVEARKAMRWAFDKVMATLEWFDPDKKPVKDIHRVCLNGIEDRKTYDVVIATNHSPASEEKLKRMRELLQVRMGDEYNVILSEPEGKGSLNGGFPSISEFRQGEVYGSKFHTFQIGVSKRVREKDRPLFIDALSYALAEIQK